MSHFSLQGTQIGRIICIFQVTVYSRVIVKSMSNSKVGIFSSKPTRNDLWNSGPLIIPTGG